MSSTTPITRTKPAHAQASGTAPAGLLLVLNLAVFLVSAEARVIAPLLPVIGNDFGVSATRAGSLITLYALPYGLFQLVYGPLADRFSRQRVMGLALLLFALGTVLSGLMPSLWALELLRTFTGAAAAGVIPVVLAYVGDAVPYGERQAALGHIISIASLGGVLSAALGGAVAAVLSWRALFVGYGLLALLAAVALLWLPVSRIRLPSTQQSRGLLAPYRALFHYAGARAWRFYGLIFFEGVAAMSTAGYLGALLAERDHLPYAAIGGLLTLGGVAGMVTARFLGPLVRRLGERGMLLGGGGLQALSYLLLPLQPTWLWFPLALLLGGVGFIVAHSTLQARATELAPAQRGTAVALFAFALLLGSAGGTWLAGLGIAQVGYTPVLLITAGALALFSVLATFEVGAGHSGATTAE